MKAVLYLIAALVIGLSSNFAAGKAQASAVIPSPTDITFNGFFLDFVDTNGLLLAPLVPAELVLPTLTLPVTGVTELGGSGDVAVAHQGSGLAISGGPLNLSVSLQDLAIDTVAMSVFGDLEVNGLVPPSGPPMTLFQLVDSKVEGELNLLVSSDLAGIMATFLGIADLTDVNIASLEAPQLVPLPPAAWLFLSALISIFLIRKVRGRGEG